MTKKTKKSDALKAWERRQHLYTKHVERKPMTDKERADYIMICSRRGNCVPGPKPAE